MPLSDPAPREPMHARDIDCRGYRREDGLWDIEGHLVDVKSYDFENRFRGEVKAGEPVHGMWLRLTIDEDMLIHAAEAVTDFGPYPDCPRITGQFRQLAGIRIGPGWIRRVHERVGGVDGCTHLRELLRPLATTAYQTLVPARRRKGQGDVAEGKRPPILDTCHAYRSDGEVVRRVWPDFYTGAV